MGIEHGPARRFRIRNGQPKDTNLDTYTLLRMGNVPEVEIEFMPSTETPVGVGEPTTSVIAPAIGNAIFAATGAPPSSPDSA